ncbi:MAG: HD domain-containing protein [Anaerosomatales bacterium]|nr:HD domain-containing protein [Anaerosomatales bacterium]MDT8434881.1 HD domain-containing protein [Anaerosomatales bacterium]
MARRLHSAQVDKAGVPYTEHCRRVAEKLTEPTTIAIAWLHDVLEDTEMDEAELREEFEAEIVDAVVALTRVSGEPTEAYYDRVRANRLARQVKLADIHDNLDPLRLVQLDEPTAARLIAKYGKALTALFG